MQTSNTCLPMNRKMDWEIKLISTRFGDVMAGICTKPNCIEKDNEFRYLTKKESAISYCYYGYYRGSNTYKNESGSQQTVQSNLSPWKANETLHLEFDSNEWTLAFSKNGEKITKMKLKENECYYPAMTLCHNRDECKLMFGTQKENDSKKKGFLNKTLNFLKNTFMN